MATGSQGIQGVQGPAGYNTAVQLINSNGGIALNDNTPSTIGWQTQSFIDSDYSHSTTTNNSRVRLVNADRYRVSYTVSGNNTSNATKTIRCFARLNGAGTLPGSIASTIIPGGFFAGTENNQSSISHNFFITTTNTNSYVEILCGNGAGATGNFSTISNESMISISRY